MENKKWQAVPGLANAFVYPCVRRPDVLSCNSYLLEFPELRVLIDPGALPQQTGDLLRVVANRAGGRILPLLVFVTHCHLDHCREIPAHLSNLTRPAWLAAQEQGAQALAEADGRKTAAELYGLDMRPAQTRIPLLTEADVRTLQSRRIPLAKDLEVHIRTEKRGESVRQLLDFGAAVPIEIVPCAGHSPDSVCFRIGGLLFIGDLLAASRPLVAGLHGWSSPHLKESLDVVIQLLEEGEILWCCPGHGDPLPVAKTLDLLRRQREKAARAGVVAEMGLLRLFQTVEMALELIDEGEEVFSALSGRLLYVSDRLEMLEEPDMARRCRASMDMDAVDALLETFRNLCRALAAGNIPRVVFASEVLPLVEKLRKIVAVDQLGAFLPAALVNRAQRLLLDFMGVAQGFPNLEEFVPVDLGVLLSEVDQAWRSSPHLDIAIGDCVDDREKFAAALARRIGHPPLARRMSVSFEEGSGAPLVHVAAIRFSDTLIQFLEWLALAGAGSAAVEGGREGVRQFVEIRPASGVSDGSTRMRGKLRAFGRRFALSGFELVVGPEHFRLVHAETASSG